MGLVLAAMAVATFIMAAVVVWKVGRNGVDQYSTIMPTFVVLILMMTWVAYEAGKAG